MSVIAGEILESYDMVSGLKLEIEIRADRIVFVLRASGVRVAWCGDEKQLTSFLEHFHHVRELRRTDLKETSHGH